MSLDFPLSVWSRNFFFFLSRKGERGCAFAVFLAPFPEKGILDYIAHRPIIQVFTVAYSKVTRNFFSLQESNSSRASFNSLSFTVS